MASLFQRKMFLFRTEGHDVCNSFKYLIKMSSMFIAALFTIAKLWKHPRCPSTDEWIKKM
jgi:hypothetical protein